MCHKIIVTRMFSAVLILRFNLRQWSSTPVQNYNKQVGELAVIENVDD